MEKSEVKTSVKAIYLQAAALAGFEVGPNSPERLVKIVERGFVKVEQNRTAEAVANVLRLIAMTLELAEKNNVTLLQETNVDAARDKICPVYPFGQKSEVV
jgi:hypothetical protein